jgi:molecular chaperone DnaK (HSP70)
MIGYKVGKGGVEIVLNESSSRSSKPIINFRGNERNIGDAAGNLERQLLENSVKDLIRLVGITEAQFEIEKKWWNMPLRFENGHPIITLQLEAGEQDFTVESLLAMLLTKFKNDCLISMNSFILCIAHPI